MDSSTIDTNESARAADAVATGGETIMVAEDETMVRNLVLKVLARDGYTVMSAESGEACLEILRTHDGPLDLLLSDVVMPGMNGKELYEEVRKLYPEVKVLLMSGYTQDIITDRGVLRDGTPFIQKPFTIAALASQVRAILDGS